MSEQENIIIEKPQADVAKVAEIDGLLKWSQEVKVTNNAERLKAIETAKEVKAFGKQVKSWFADSKAKSHAAWKAIVAQEKQLTDRLGVIEAGAKRAIEAFDDEQEALRIAEQRRLQALEEERARKERERLEKQAAKLKTPEKRAERLEMAEMVAPVIVDVESTIEKTEGESTRKDWKATVIDESKVPRGFMIPDLKAINAYARATKGTKQIEGVRIYAKRTLALR